MNAINNLIIKVIMINYNRLSNNYRLNFLDLLLFLNINI